MRRLLVPALLFLLPAVSSCGNSHADGVSGETRSPVSVLTTVVAMEPEPVRWTLSGEVVAVQRFTVATPFAGRVLDLPVTEGSRVRRGELLARVDAPEAEAAVVQARAAEAAAGRAAETARRQAERFRRLAADEVVTPRDLELAELDLAARIADHEAAGARRVSAEENLGYAVLRSPQDGIVVERRVRAGDLATPGLPLLVLETLGDKEVRVTFPAEQLGGIRAGLRAEVVAGPGSAPVPAVVDRVSPSARQQTGEAFLKLAGGDLPSGTFVAAEILGETTRPGLRLPERALVRRGSLTGAFLVHEGRAVLRWLRLDRDLRVLAGLGGGETVVLDPPSSLRDGDPVDLRTEVPDVGSNR